MPPSTPSTSTHYALVIDAGSSGSRLQIYSWRDPDLERAEILAEVGEAKRGRGSGGKGKWWWGGKDGYRGKGKEREGEMARKALRRLVRVGKGVEGENWVKRVEPGISTISPEGVPEYLSPLLTHALQQIPPSQHAHTPIYVLATAGMRLLPPDERDAILSATCTSLRKDYPFLVGESSSSGPCGENVRVITGEEEGIWGWVAVNYLMDGFGHAPDPFTTTTALSSSTSGLLPLAPLAEAPSDSLPDSVTPVDVNHHSPTFGFLDMGGASTQLAFSPTPAEISRSQFPLSELETVSLRLLSGEEVQWPVFVASWLGFGTNRVRERYVEKLIQSWKEDVNDGRVDENSPIQDPCLPISLTLDSSDPTQHPGFIGTGSFATCLSELRPLLASETPCPTNHCLFAGLPTPYIDFERDDQRGFIGISEYWYTAQQVLGLGGVWDWGEWENGMSQFCAREWIDIESEVENDKGWRGSQVELSRLQMQCFKGAWISNVLHEGIGIPRLVDAGGNDTLTGGSLGETNAEAERRAKQKGLQSKSHFQSMDEVGETAISWTLGKMVIEASKAIPLQSTNPWIGWMSSDGISGFAIGGFERQMTAMGIQVVWGYALVALVLLSCVFTSVRRRSSRWSTNSPRRGRKPSISGDLPRLSPSSGVFSWPWVRDADPSLSVEEGYDVIPTPTKSSTRLTGRIRLWSLRLGNMLKRLSIGHHDSRSRTMRHTTMPLSVTSYNPYTSTNGYSVSQPTSPKRESFFFTPATLHSSASGSSLSNGNLTVPITRPGSTTPEPRSGRLVNGILSASTSSIDIPNSATTSQNMGLTSSPPRLKATTSRPGRPRQNSNTHTYSSLNPVDISSSSMTTSRNSTSSSAGWNDPPMSAFLNNGIDGSGTLGDRPHSGILTPTAGLYPDFPSLSRNSSRVNLSEIGLAQRSTSRANTPHDFDETP